MYLDNLISSRLCASHHLSYLLGLGVTLLSAHCAPLLAQSNPIIELERECVGSGGLGLPCTPDGNECAGNSIADACVTDEDGASRCYASCEGEGLQGDPSRCTVGEQCVFGSGQYYCRPVPFQMDLNLLDQCVAYWLEGGTPAWSDNRCSLEANLNRLLDQNQDYSFDIFDLDLCVLSFLERPEPPESLFCDEDEDCGTGLYCDPDTRGCTRECGLIASREEGIGALDRVCTGPLKICDYQRGRCERMTIEEVTALTCQVDRECPSGAYCFLGQCAPQCSRAIDCPSSEWYCTDTNSCRVLPDPASEGEGFVFDPSQYAIRFARKRLDLNGIQTRDQVPLAIMDLITRQQVRENPSVSFGYRLQLKYGIKEDRVCLSPFPKDCSDESQRDLSVDPTEAACVARRADCIIDPQTESWVRLTSPFGVVSAVGDPYLRVELEEEIADRLSPGTYRATLKVVYDNGDSDELQIYYTKKTPSGEYAGQFSVYYDDERYTLSGLTPMNMAFKIYLSEEDTSWDDLLFEEGVTPAIRDVAVGKKVYAYLHGEQSISFARPELPGETRDDHDVPFLGVYYPSRGLLRLIGRSVIPAGYSEGDGGGDAVTIKAENLFKRDVERLVELFGVFNTDTGYYFGLYSEQIKGLTPTDFTLRGAFGLTQRLADSSKPHGYPFDLIEPTEGFNAQFPSQSELITELDAKIMDYCVGPERERFQDLDAFEDYVRVAQEYCDPSSPTARLCEPTIFPNLIYFSDLVGEALSSLGSGAEEAYLTVYDFLRSRVRTCAEEDSCTSDDDCQPGFVCNTRRALCVRDSERLYQRGERCSDQDPSSCPTGELCDLLSELCLPKMSTTPCTSNASCASGELCMRDPAEGANGARHCVVDLSNYACLPLTYDDFSVLNGQGQSGAIPTAYADLISRTRISYDELSMMLPDSMSSGDQKTLCVNADAPAEFQGYSAYFGGDEALCVSENSALCGLYLHQKALLMRESDGEPWVNLGNFEAEAARLVGAEVITNDLSGLTEEEREGVSAESADPTLPLFCDETISLSNCVGYADMNQDGAVSNPEVARFILQEHNRFWLHLSQALKFEGDSNLSDAFMTLYRNQENPFAEGAALVYKREHQALAMSRFDQLLEVIGSSSMAQVFFNWPISAYLQRGNDWLSIMQTISSDRIEALASIVDLDRRVFLQRELTSKYDVLQNVMQQEYLYQAYLLKLQIDWQADPGFSASYEGRSEAIFRQGQQIINQLNIKRNEIGLFDQQVYFESSRTREQELSNFQNYLKVLTGESGDDGMLGEARQDVAEAVVEMKSALRDLDSLEEKIFAARREISGYMAEQCGPTASELQATMGATSFKDENHDGQVDYCDYLLHTYTDDELVTALRDCKTAQGDDATRRQACARLGAAFGVDVSSTFTYSCAPKPDPSFLEALVGLVGDVASGAGSVVGAIGDATGTSAVTNVIADGADAAADGLQQLENFLSNTVDGPPTYASNDYGQAGEACRDVVASFTGATDQILGIGDATPDPLTAPPRCDLNRFSEYSVTLAGRKRLCVGGQMGSLIQEKRLLEFKREQVLGSLETLLKRFTQTNGMGAELQRLCIENENSANGGDRCTSPRQAMFISNQVFDALELAYETLKSVAKMVADVTKDMAGGADCVIIAGLAGGTSCPMSIVAAIGESVSDGLRGGVVLGLDTAFKVKSYAMQIASGILESRGDQAEVRNSIMEMVREVDDLITEFQTLTMEIFNANLQIDDLKYQISANYGTYQDDVRFILDHIVGRESGNLLRGRRLAMESDAQFRKVLQYSYRAFMAFLHEYNISPASAEPMRNRLMNAVTLDDLERFIDELKTYELEYCGREGIDCDSLSNVEVVRISLRELLYPNLKPETGRNNEVITVGEQFHNLITSPPKLKQVVLNQMPAEVIEVNFTTPLTLQEFGPDGPHWLIDPLECNHHLVSSENVNDAHPGNVAVNFKGHNLNESERSIRYELVRGSVDYLRSCHAEVTVEEAGLPPVSEYTVRPFVVGYAPQSNEAQLDAPRSFATRSGQLTGCLNASESTGGLSSGAECWRFFARGRSLSSMDWRLRIPIKLDDANTESSWLMGRGLGRDERPIIEDIVIYLRYSSRPTSEE